MNEKVIKMARLMGGCKDRTCEDCLSQSKKLFGDNKCVSIEYAEVLDKAGYRKQSDVVKELLEELINTISNIKENYDVNSQSPCKITPHNIFTVLNKNIKELAEQYGKEDK